MSHDDGWSTALMRFLREREERRANDKATGQAAITELAKRLKEGAVACQCWAFALKAATYLPESAADDGHAPLKEPIAKLSKIFETLLDPVTGRFRATDNLVLNSFLDGAGWSILTRIVGKPAIFLKAHGTKYALRIDDAEVIEKLGIAFIVVGVALKQIDSRSVVHEARSRRKGHPHDGGRLPQMEVIHLLEWARNRGMGCRGLAKRLVESGVSPDPLRTGPVDPELANQFLAWNEQAPSKAKGAKQGFSRDLSAIERVSEAVETWERRLKSTLHEIQHPRQGRGGKKR